MAYYAAFSLFPLCLVLIALLGFAMRFSAEAQSAHQGLVNLVSERFDTRLADSLNELLAGVRSRAAFGGPIGAITLVFGAIGVFLQLENMFDRIWGTPADVAKGWLGVVGTVLHQRLSAFVMLLATGGLLLLIFLADIVLAGIRPHVVHSLPAGGTAWHYGQIGFIFLCNALLFALLYKTLPKTKIRWRDALRGGILVAVVWMIGQKILTLLVVGSSYQNAYGVVGSFMAIMLWFYYISATVVLGAEFVRAICPNGSDVAKGR